MTNFADRRTERLEEYALTAAEARRAIVFYKIFEDAIQKFTSVSSMGLREIVLPADGIEYVKQCCEKKRISLSGLNRLAGRVFENDWYTLLLLANAESLHKIRPGFVGSILLTRENYATGRGVLVEESIAGMLDENGNHRQQPLFFDVDRIEKTRQSLELPKGYRFLYQHEFEALIIAQGIVAATESVSVILPGFRTIRQGPVTNALATLNTTKQKPKSQNAIADVATFVRGDLEISFSDFVSKNLKLDDSAVLLLDYLVVVATEQGMNNQTVVVPLKRYMQTRGITDETKARAVIARDMEALFSARLSFKPKKGNSFYEIRIASAKGIVKNSDIVLSFTNEFWAILNQYTIMPLPEEYFKLRSHNNPNSRAFLRKLCELKNMNGYKVDVDIVSVKTLLEIAPSLPKYEDLQAHKRVKQLIIEPFERDLNALSDLLTWNYCHSGGKPLSSDELQGFNYAVFSKAMLQITWKNYPDQTKRREDYRKEKAVAATAQPKKKRGRPRKNPE